MKGTLWLTYLVARLLQGLMKSLKRMIMSTVDAIVCDSELVTFG